MGFFVNVKAIDCLTMFSCVFRTCGPQYNSVSICRSENLFRLRFNHVGSHVDSSRQLNFLGFLDK